MVICRGFGRSARQRLTICAEQLANLVFAGFLSATATTHLVDLPRYLQAARSRLDTLLSNPARDQAGLEIVLRCEDAYAELCAACAAGTAAGFRG